VGRRSQTVWGELNMSTHTEPCNCDQALALTKALDELVTYVETHEVDLDDIVLRSRVRTARALLDSYSQENCYL